jgi:hypothetical protein
VIYSFQKTVAFALALWLWNQSAHAGQAEWIVVEWIGGKAREIPQKSFEACKALALEKAKSGHAACFSRAEVEALKKYSEDKK